MPDKEDKNEGNQPNEKKDLPQNESNVELPKYLKEDIDKNIKRGKLQNEIIQDLRTNPRYKVFFAQYDAYWVESFIKEYANKKSMYLEFGPMYKRLYEEKVLRYINMAEKKLWEIQQKKLFNLQCQWRAEQIKIPEVSVCIDFEYWGEHIKNCPFLDPITEEEFELYLSYWQTDPNVQIEDIMSWGGWRKWQDYKHFKQEYVSQDDEQSCTIPDWYEFYDSRRGTGSLMLLPDTRGEKENFYVKLYREDEKAKKIAAGTYQEYQPASRKLRLSGYDKNDLEKFIKKFENLELLELFKVYETKNSVHDDYELENAIKILMGAEEKCSINSHYDWRQAVIDASHNYEKSRLIAALRPAYESYLQRLRMGFGYEKIDDKEDYFIKLCEAHKEWIIKGRVLNGEPADLNF